MADNEGAEMGINKPVDFANPATLKAAAAFPFYGQAESLIRLADPLWKVDPSIEHEWLVQLLRVCGCNCPHCIESECEDVTIVANTKDEAEELASASYAGWEIVEARLTDRRDVPFPEWIYEIGGVA